MTNVTNMLHVKYGAIQSGSGGTGSLSVPKFSCGIISGMLNV